MHNDLTMLGYQNLPLEALPSARVVRDWSHALLPLSDLQAGSWMARQTHATYGFDASSKLGDHVAVLIASAREEGKKRRSMMLGGCFLTHSTAEAGLADMLVKTLPSRRCPTRWTRSRASRSAEVPC
jgi:hypothetical protein